ncbi:DUF1269 domain-containing protein [Geodermatophilus sp. SYSU D00696]
MATLSVWRFDSPQGADMALDTLTDLQKQELVHVHDAATVSWYPGDRKPKTHQADNLVGSGALGGGFWGLLLGLVFFVPLLGAAIGAAFGALGGAMGDVGIDDDFIREVRDQVTPGTSALFVMTSDVVPDKVRSAFEVHRPHLITTNLSAAEEERLRAAFAD